MADDAAAAANNKKEVPPAKFIEIRVTTAFAGGGPNAKFSAKYATEPNE